MIKKAVSAILLCCASVTSFASAENEAKFICNQLNGEVQEIQKQLPMTINYMTKMVGVSTTYLSGVCSIYYHYVLDTNSYINNLDSNLFPYQETLNYLKSSEGVIDMRAQMEQAASNSFDSLLKPIKSYRNVTVRVGYRWDNPSIKPIDLVLLDTRK